MVEHQQQLMGHQDRVSGKTLLFASLAVVALGGPLLGLMGFVFVSTVTFLLVISPLLIIFSPILLGGAFVLMAVMAGFAAAGTMAIAGLTTLGWFFRTTGLGRFNPSWAVDKMIGSEDEGKKTGERTQMRAQSLVTTV